MGNMVEMKEGISKFIMLLLRKVNCLRGNTSNKWSAKPLPEQASYGKSKVLLFVLTASMPLGLVDECPGVTRKKCLPLNCEGTTDQRRTRSGPAWQMSAFYEGVT